MRTIKFFLLSGFFLFLFSVLLFGLDFGGVIDNSTGIDYMDEATLQQSDKLSLWFNGGMGANVDFYARGSFKYINEKPELRLNLDLLRLNGAFATEEGGPPNFSFSFGRFNIADFTNYVFEHTADGLLLGFRFPAARIRTFFGFTGLLFKHSSDILISSLDAYDSVNDDVLLAPWRVVGLVDVTFQELFLRQNLTVSFLFQEDVRNADDLIEEGEEQPVAGGGHVDTQYLGLGLSGPILSNLYYNAFFYLAPGRTLSYLADSKSATGYSYQYDSILSYMAGGGVSLFLREFLFSRIALNFLLTSGDEDAASFTEGNTDGYSGIFIPISRETLALVFSPRLGNIFLFNLSYSMRPFSRSKSPALSNFQAILKTLMFFRTSTGPISEPGINTVSSALYLGTEIDGIVNFRPFSDLGAALSLGLFLPNNGDDGAFLNSARKLEFLGRLEFSLSL